MNRKESNESKSKCSKVRERAARRACRGLGTALSGKAAARNDFRDI